MSLRGYSHYSLIISGLKLIKIIIVTIWSNPIAYITHSAAGMSTGGSRQLTVYKDEQKNEQKQQQKKKIKSKHLDRPPGDWLQYSS